MKKSVLFLNSKFDTNEEYYQKINFSEYNIYCADGGANSVFKLGLVPKAIIGDMDSIEENVLKHFEKKGCSLHVYPKEKDKTDMELTIEYILEKSSCEELLVLGGLGNRIDHTIANIFLLKKYPQLVFENSSEKVFLVNKSKTIYDVKEKTVSLLPLGKVRGISLEGFKYSAEDLELNIGDTTGISNIIKEDVAEIKVSKGNLLVIINKNKV